LALSHPMKSIVKHCIHAKSGCQTFASLFEIINYYNNKIRKELMKGSHPSFNFKVSFYTSIAIWLLMSKVVKSHVKIKKSNKMWCKVQDKMQGDVPRNYLGTLANSTLIILFSEMLKFSKIISSKSKNIVKQNNGYLRIFHLLKWMFQKLNYSMDMCWNGQGTIVMLIE
jgi:hypothetical protein